MDVASNKEKVQSMIYHSEIQSTSGQSLPIDSLIDVFGDKVVNVISGYAVW